MSIEEMQSIVQEQLVTIDEILAKRGTPLRHRPFAAATLFVEVCILEIRGDTKDDFLTKRWFADIYRWTEDWYRDRYGEALKYRGEDAATGIVRVYGTPFAVKVPLTIIKPEDPGKRVWVTFPVDVMPDESPCDWLAPRPNVERVSPEDLRQLKEEIAFVASSLRLINVNLMTAQCAAEEQMLGGSISAHLEKAVHDILSGRPEQISVAFWEIHLAIEKTIKLFLRQKRGTAPNSHDLSDLRQIAEAYVCSNELDIPFAKCPSAKQAISYRYGENSEVSPNDAIEYYLAALGIVRFYTKALHHKFVMNNARFLIQAPPWQCNRDGR